MQNREKDPALVYFTKVCKELGLKLTPQRMAIYKEISQSKTHPTAEHIYKKIIDKYPNISFDTVNRTLLTFVEVGLLTIIEGFGNSRRYDPNLNNHHHVHCIKCGMILDFEDKECDKLKIPNSINRQYKILSKKVVINGICKECQKK